jgi:cytochrome P450
MVLVKLDAAPFGAGPHACPGRSIALTIARVARRYLR